MKKTMESDLDLDLDEFKDLTEAEKEYFRIMQAEAEFNASQDYRPGKFEIIFGILFCLLYILSYFI